MNKLAISIAISSVLGLSACGDTTLEDVKQETQELQQEVAAKAAEKFIPRVSVVWDPSGGNISVPNDLLLSGTIDGTLEMPDETSAKNAGEAVDFGNPAAAIGALDGWGTQNTFTIALNYADPSVTIDPTTILSGDAVSVYQVEKFPSLTDPDCTNAAYSGLICKGLDKLTFGVDYVTSMAGGSIAITPLKALKAGASYAIALTKEIKDTNGNSLMPSSTYGSVEQDIETTPLVLPSLTAEELNSTQAGIRLLQTMTNNFENSLASAFGANKDSIVYTQVFTVQSAGVATSDPLQITKLLNAKTFAAAALSEDPMVQISAAFPIVSQGYTVANALVGAGAIENDPASTPYALFNSANLYGGYIDVPYYLENTTTGNPLTGRWEAACDSGAILKSATAEQLAAGTPGTNHATCQALGLADLGLDTQRHLTKYNPVPAVKSMEKVEVQITLPNIDNANIIRGINGLSPITAKPDAGWPVVILQHGITSNKNDMLAATGFLSMFGFATVAIDHPLHATRGFVSGEGETAKVINASSAVTGNDPTHYLNLSSLLTARDNLRQSIADTLKLRLSLNGLVDATAAVDASGNLADPSAIVRNIVDSSKVYYMGHSLGAITGASFTAIANSPVSAALVTDSTIEDEAVRQATAEATASQLAALYKVNASMLANPGSSIANFLLESGSFGDLVSASVVYGLGNELTEAMSAYLTPAALGAIIAANPSCAAATTDQNTALVCAYNAFKAEASAEQLAGIQAGLQQFAFAAQTVLEAGDPTNYAATLKATNTPVLMVEMVGDIELGGANPSDQVIPNSIATNPLAGTTGLANQLGLASVTESMLNSSETVSGIVRYTKGSHSTMLSPSTSLPEPYKTIYGSLNQELQLMMSYFFLSDGHSIQVSQGIIDNCIIQDTSNAACNP
ncbi:hypothetical protein RT723_01000 [Psychrosphaera aquimarina]|uniref:Bacterial virulence factor lipase N-terminal domain-containing protein n=1 Tax=Psychrosphaera aquimarina TaxID=2044854 RepID=A0ABU3QX36_9GAMM|nr:VolA/Pla-1 family phospholipase [Psychrosphaera aquimarina]MDU0111608.1 hypothetical protein [Psychrosphaera aquimarina]